MTERSEQWIAASIRQCCIQRMTSVRMQVEPGLSQCLKAFDLIRKYGLAPWQTVNIRKIINQPI